MSAAKLIGMCSASCLFRETCSRPVSTFAGVLPGCLCLSPPLLHHSPPTVPAAKLSRRLSAGTACSEQQTCLRSGGGRRNQRAPGRSRPFPLPMEEAVAVLNVAGNDFAVWKNDSKMAARECDPAGPSKVKGVDLLPHFTACLQN